MSRVDVIVLGAGIVGVSTALQLVKRGLSVALLDRQSPGEGTSYGNAGVLGGAGVYPTGFPRDFKTLLRVALKIAPQANFHWADLPALAPFLRAYYRASSREGLEETARLQRPLMAAALAEHETLMAEANALRYLRRDGWLTIYRTDAALSTVQPMLALGEELGAPSQTLGLEATLALEPHLAPVFRHAILWPDIANVSNPLALTRAYVARFLELRGEVVRGDARTLQRTGNEWRVKTDTGPMIAKDVLICTGPWLPEILREIGVKLPFAVKRGYHWHHGSRGNANLTRPVLDRDYGYVLAPMEQGIRVTSGVEFARRDAPPTPVQFGRLMPAARKLYPGLDAPVEPTPWMGARPSVPDMRPVIGAVPRRPGLWFNTAHNHYGLTLGPVTGNFIADLMMGRAPICDPGAFAPDRFSRA